MLNGHERAVTQIKYNREGDLLFTVAKNKNPNVWFTENGERLGTYVGHEGAVWCCDVNWTSTKLITGAADNTAIIWDVETGRVLNNLTTNTAVRTCGFSFCGNVIMFTTDQSMGHTSHLMAYDTRDSFQMSENEPFINLAMSGPGSKISSAVWGPLGETIITGHENGNLTLYSVKEGDMIQKTTPHTALISDLQPSHDLNMLMSSSKDHTAKLFDMRDLDLKKTFKTERPVNSAALSPTRDHVVLGGGQEAMEVTTTSTKIGKFDARFYHLLFEEEFARIKGHFGPINTLAFHPSGNKYSSGGEDGYVRMLEFDPEYYTFELESS